MEEKQPADSLSASAPLNEDQIIAAHVQPAQPWNGPIYLAPYDPAWPELFLQLKAQIEAALGGKVRQLEHVGSTSVPGLAAKPVIDIVLAVADSRDEADYVGPLEARGFRLPVREPDWFEHRLLRPAEIRANLHVFTQGCEEIERMVLFRDWLRTHPDDRQLYEATKRELASRIWKYTQNYADAKAGVVRAILARAHRRATG